MRPDRELSATGPATARVHGFSVEPRRSRVRRWLIITLLGGTIGFIGASAFFAVRFTSRVPRSAGSFDGWLPGTTESVHFAARDGISLSGWFVPCPGAKQAVALLHGHQASRRQMLARARLLHEHGLAVLLYDARGHGESAGELVSIGWFETRDLLG